MARPRAGGQARGGHGDRCRLPGRPRAHGCRRRMGTKKQAHSVTGPGGGPRHHDGRGSRRPRYAETDSPRCRNTSASPRESRGRGSDSRDWFSPLPAGADGQACVPHSPLTPGGISREIIRNFMEVWKWISVTTKQFSCTNTNSMLPGASPPAYQENCNISVFVSVVEQLSAD